MAGDLALDPADVVVLVLAFHLKCENMCEFTRSGWQNGWLALGCDNISSMKAAVETMRQELDDPQKAKAETHGKSITKDTWSLPWSGIGFLLAL
ncbi:hypothetical protein BSLG_004183 [Batrachochytrium salamandrivorans]|nr:hypothetical protein BSLG_004183 [Batrachochytrium salamandrivorans]